MGRIVRKTMFEQKCGIWRLAAQNSRSVQRCQLRPPRLLRSRCLGAAGKRAWALLPSPLPSEQELFAVLET